MSLLIDGYNLIHAAGIVGRGRGPGGLERSRLRLLNILVESLPAETVAQTTVVFDASNAPPGLPPALRHRGLAVRFAKGYENADALLEELIQQNSTPRRLTVVSSDHRVQRAARRRKAQAIDSDVWYRQVLDARTQQELTPLEDAKKPEVGGSSSEVEFWLARFLDESTRGAVADDQVFPPGFGLDEEDDEKDDLLDR